MSLIFETTHQSKEVTFRTIQRGDEKLLARFAQSISPNTQRLFAPYRWNTPEQNADFRAAVKGSCSGEHPAYLLLAKNDVPLAHGALWGAGTQHEYQGTPLTIPTIGLCIADAYQEQGLGKLCMQFLHIYARVLGADAIELTHEKENERSRALALSSGFTDIGELTIPLGVNPAANDVQTPPRGWRTERHMMYVFDEDKKPFIQAYLRSKQTP